MLLDHDLQSAGLEKILVIFLPGSFILLRRKTWARFIESTILIDLCNLLDNVVVESTGAPWSTILLHHRA